MVNKDQFPARMSLFITLLVGNISYTVGIYLRLDGLRAVMSLKTANNR